MRLVVQEHVGELDVAMDHRGAVETVNGFQQLKAEAFHFRLTEGPLHEVQQGANVVLAVLEDQEDTICLPSKRITQILITCYYYILLHCDHMTSFGGTCRKQLRAAPRC